jgi:hypothetical protein
MITFGEESAFDQKYRALGLFESRIPNPGFLNTSTALTTR